jgi:hypothetical protein
LKKKKKKRKADGMCLKNTACQKCPDYEVGDPFGSCKRYGYGVGRELAKRQKVCE